MNIHLPSTPPVHTYTGLTAIGWRRNGAPIWPVRGGSGDGEPGADGGGAGGQGDADSDGGDGGDQLGDAGKKALDDMKAKWHGSRDALKPWSALAREYGVKNADELKQLLAGKKAEGDQADTDRIRREATAEVTEKANARIVRAEVKALAAGKFADPADAPLYLDLTKFEVDDDGNVDSDEITTALDDLLKKKPHLAAQGGRRFAGGGDGGHRGSDGPANVPAGIPRLAHAYANASTTKTTRT